MSICIYELQNKQHKYAVYHSVPKKYTAVSKKVVIVNSRSILEPKEILGSVIMSDNTPAKGVLLYGCAIIW